MLKNILLLPLLLFFLNGSSQTLPAFKPLRYDEDYQYLKNDSSRNWYKNTKYSPLSWKGNTYISFGGDVREQYFNVKNESWGEQPPDHDGYLFSRWLLHADLHAGPRFRTFVQLQSTLSNGKPSTSPVDENPLEIHQAFADYQVTNGPKHKLTVRFGRQELSYGSQRIVSVREGPNNRQSFDGLKTIFLSGNYKADVFYTHHVGAKKGLFDDGLNRNVKLWGTYFTRSKLPLIKNIDVYYLGLHKRTATFDDGKGKELRNSIGSRIWNNKAPWRYDVEGLYQFGKFDGKDIAAWTGSVYTSYEWTGAYLSPELGIKTELISGDKYAGDNRLQTFNPLFPRGGYFGLASLIGPSNLIDVHPSVTLAITPKLDWNVDYDVFWRYSRNDGIYAPSTALIYSGKNISPAFIGQQWSSELIYIPNDFIYLRTEITWFRSGDFLKAAGPGKDILFFGVTMQAKF